MALKVASSNLATHLIVLIKTNPQTISLKKAPIFFFKNKHTITQFENVFNIFVKILFLSSFNNLKKYQKNTKHIYITHFNKKLVLFKNKIDFKNQFYLFILNLKKKKPSINIMIKKRNVLGLSIGIVLRYLHIKEKKLKKKLSSLYLMLKITLIMMQKQILSSKKIIFEIKGLRKDIYLIIKFLKLRLLFKNLTLIHTPCLNGNSLKYKKIRSIKKNLKKKLIKVD